VQYGVNRVVPSFADFYSETKKKENKVSGLFLVFPPEVEKELSNFRI
jgi:hypothetical protein